MVPPPERHYAHRFHAGNVGDVWKHVAVIAVLEALEHHPSFVVDTHGGAGAYALGPTGEWTEGIGKLATQLDASAPRAVRRYAELVGLREGQNAPNPYAGSPLLLASCLPTSGRLVAFELDPPVAKALRDATGSDPRVEVREGDGIAQLGTTLEAAGSGGEDAFVLVDPPYADRREWELVPAAMVAALRQRPKATLVLWYPVKSLARPNAMLARLEKQGVAAVAIELITSPLTSKKNRLNGSGVVVFEPSSRVTETLSSAAAWLGPRLAVHGGFFNVRVTGFGRTARAASALSQTPSP